MIEVLNWISANPKMTLGMLTIVGVTIYVCIHEWLDRKYGERF